MKDWERFQKAASLHFLQERKKASEKEVKDGDRRGCKRQRFLGLRKFLQRTKGGRKETEQWFSSQREERKVIIQKEGFRRKNFAKIGKKIKYVN